MNNNKTSFKRFSFECEPIPENQYWYNLRTEDGVYIGTVRVSDAWRLTVERDNLQARIDSALAALSGIEFVHDTKTGIARAIKILEEAK